MIVPVNEKPSHHEIVTRAAAAFATRPAFTGPASQPVLRFLGSPERLLVAGEQSGGEFALFEATGERGHTSPRHRHRRATETFIVLPPARRPTGPRSSSWPPSTESTSSVPA